MKLSKLTEMHQKKFSMVTMLKMVTLRLMAPSTETQDHLHVKKEVVTTPLKMTSQETEEITANQEIKEEITANQEIDNPLETLGEAVIDLTPRKEKTTEMLTQILTLKFISLASVEKPENKT